MKIGVQFTILAWFLSSQTILVWQVTRGDIGEVAIASSFLSFLALISLALAKKKPEIFDGIYLFTARIKSIFEEITK